MLNATSEILFHSYLVAKAHLAVTQFLPTTVILMNCLLSTLLFQQQHFPN